MKKKKKTSENPFIGSPQSAYFGIFAKREPLKSVKQWNRRGSVAALRITRAALVCMLSTL